MAGGRTGVTRSGVVVRAVAVLTLLGVLGILGCTESQTQQGAPRPAVSRVATEPIGLTASDTAVLRAAKRAKEPTEPLSGQCVRLLEKLDRQLRDAPFVAGASVPLVGALEATPTTPTPPAGDPRRSDAFEPDGVWGQAKRLSRDTSQTRTISGPDDVDWIEVPIDVGANASLYVVHSGLITYEGSEGKKPEARPSDSYADEKMPLLEFVRGRLSRDPKRSLWVRISAKQPITYSIANLSRMPSNYTGVEEPYGDYGEPAGFGGNIGPFLSAVAALDSEVYYEATGRHASQAELRRLRSRLLGGGTRYEEGLFYSPIWSADAGTLERLSVRPLGAKKPLAVWTRSVRRGRAWMVEAAGHDATFARSPYLDMFAAYETLKRSPIVPLGRTSQGFLE
jgi:hypothetical protein